MSINQQTDNKVRLATEDDFAHNNLSFDRLNKAYKNHPYIYLTIKNWYNARGYSIVEFNFYESPTESEAHESDLNGVDISVTVEDRESGERMTETIQHKTRPRQSSGYITGFTWEVAVANRHVANDDVAEFVKPENKIEFKKYTQYKPDLEKVLYGEYADYVVFGRHQVMSDGPISVGPASHFILDVEQFRNEFKNGIIEPSSPQLLTSPTSNTRSSSEVEYFFPWDIQDMMIAGTEAIVHTVSYLKNGKVCIMEQSQPDDLTSDIDVSKAENIITAYLDDIKINYECEANNERIKSTILAMIKDV